MTENNLINCLTCYKPVAKTATKCPHCGAPTPRQQGVAMVSLLFGGLWIAWLTWAFYGNEIRLWLKVHGLPAGF